MSLSFGKRHRKNANHATAKPMVTDKMRTSENARHTLDETGPFPKQQTAKQFTAFKIHDPGIKRGKLYRSPVVKPHNRLAITPLAG